MTVTHNSYHQKAQNCNKTLFVTKRAFVEIKMLPEQPEFCTTNCSHIPKVFHLCKTFDVALIVINIYYYELFLLTLLLNTATKNYYTSL